jgi:2-dehydro-3-deoxygluconokinase
MKTIVTFGEIMARLCPAGFLKIRQALPGGLDVTFAGAEANVAVSIASLGGDARFVTALPDNDLADACLATLKGHGVDTRRILRRDEGRLGLYFVETGANQRPGRVLYDRDHSAVSLTPGGAYDWPAILDGAGWLHFTGITPALSQTAADAVALAVAKARAAGCTISCDLNFRNKLWRWQPGLSPRELAGKVMRGLLPRIDVLIANEEDAHDVLGIAAEGADIHAGRLDAAKYQNVAEKIIAQFPNIRQVAITLRESLSASHNNWGAMLHDAAGGAAFFAPSASGAATDYRPYEIRAIVDRVGGGDAFGAALIFALNTPGLAAPAKAIAFAAAASCLAHSIQGDFNYTTRAEAEALMAGSASGRVIR